VRCAAPGASMVPSKWHLVRGVVGKAVRVAVPGGRWQWQAVQQVQAGALCGTNAGRKRWQAASPSVHPGGTQQGEWADQEAAGAQNHRQAGSADPGAVCGETAASMQVTQDGGRGSGSCGSRVVAVVTAAGSGNTQASRQVVAAVKSHPGGRQAGPRW